MSAAEPMETKVIYHLEGETTPYMVKIAHQDPERPATLEDLKANINPPLPTSEYKYIFKTEDEDFGCIVKIEVSNDYQPLPKFQSKVIAWLSPKNGTLKSVRSEKPPKIISSTPNTSQTDGIGGNKSSNKNNNSNTSSSHATVEQNAEKLSSAMRDLSIVKTSSTLPGVEQTGHKHSFPPPPPPRGAKPGPPGKPMGRYSNLRRFPSDSTLDSTMTADTFRGRKALENEFFDDGSSRYSSMTGSTAYSIYKHRKKNRRLTKRLPANHHLTDSVSTFSSMTDSTVSLNIIIATLDMRKYDTLGITLISDEGGGPVLVGYVFPTGAVAADGRIERGDIIIEINGISVEDKTTEESVEVIRREAKNPINGSITMTVAKQPLFPTEAEIMASQTMKKENQPPGMIDHFRQPSMPINCDQWVQSARAHQERMHGFANGINPYASTSSMTETSSDTLASSLPESDRWTQYGFYTGGPLTLYTDMLTVVRNMNQRGSGLDVKDRQWLKMHIPRACIGSDLVDWLHSRVQGLDDRRDARRYAASLLRAGFIKHTTDKTGFSEQCYYVFTDPVQQQQAQAELLKNADNNLPPNLNHLRYGATHLAADAMSLISESSCASTLKEYPTNVRNQQGQMPPQRAAQMAPSIAHQAGWNPGPAAAQQFWHHDTDTQSIISMSSSISQAHLKMAQQRMDKRAKKKLSKSAQSVGYKTQSGSGSSNSSTSKQNKSNPDQQSLKSSHSDGNKPNGITQRVSPLVVTPMHPGRYDNHERSSASSVLPDGRLPAPNSLIGHHDSRTANGISSTDTPHIPDNISEASCSTITSKKLLPPGKPLGYQPPEITASRLSFQYAMANPMPPPQTPTPSQLSSAASSSFHHHGNVGYRPYPQKYQMSLPQKQHSSREKTSDQGSSASSGKLSGRSNGLYNPPPPVPRKPLAATTHEVL